MVLKYQCSFNKNIDMSKAQAQPALIMCQLAPLIFGRPSSVTITVTELWHRGAGLRIIV